jgi:hypothetical protein
MWHRSHNPALQWGLWTRSDKQKAADDRPLARFPPGAWSGAPGGRAVRSDAPYGGSDLKVVNSLAHQEKHGKGRHLTSEPFMPKGLAGVFCGG